MPVGTMVYTREGHREHSVFAYDARWLEAAGSFNVSADLLWSPEYQFKRAAGAPGALPFHGALADTAPDSWGRLVIAREHARRRRELPALPALSELDYLLAVDDATRLGALRLRGEDGTWQRSPGDLDRKIPPLLELERLYHASAALEHGRESDDDLRFLIGKATSLGGARPKCSVRMSDGSLAVGKFPSQADERSVTRGEVLAMTLAREAGIRVADTRVIIVGDVPAALIRRFDRDGDRRIPYQSAATMIQAAAGEDRSYFEIADAIRIQAVQARANLHELWRRMVFNLLISNVDDHLHNHGFLFEDGQGWQLAPAFDLNPFPDKVRESKTWLSDEDGPISDLRMLMGRADYFDLDESGALEVLGDVYSAVTRWREVAVDPKVGLLPGELKAFASAFEHEELETARSLLGASHQTPRW